MADVEELRRFALHLADVADKISMHHFGGPIPAVAKADGSPVTEADNAIEAALREEITAAFPAHAVLGEEQGGHLDPSVPTWVIDPIDGTKNFMRGIPVFATLVAVVVDTRAVIGVVSAPAMGERWDAARDTGARRNGSAVGVSAIADLEDAHVLHGGLRYFRADPALWERFGQILERSWRTRGFGDFWMHLLVAGGMAEVAFERDLSIWDVAALECVIAEAGGRLTAWDGGSVLAGGDVLASNGLLHDEVRGLLTGDDDSA